MDISFRKKLKNHQNRIISDEWISKMGTYFDYFNLGKIYGWNFEQFLLKVLNDEFDPKVYTSGMIN